jgi:hypothetical protein
MEMQNLDQLAFALQPRSGAAYSEPLGGPDGLSTKHLSQGLALYRIINGYSRNEQGIMVYLWFSRSLIEVDISL